MFDERSRSAETQANEKNFWIPSTPSPNLPQPRYQMELARLHGRKKQSFQGS